LTRGYTSEEVGTAEDGRQIESEAGRLMKMFRVKRDEEQWREETQIEYSCASAEEEKLDILQDGFILRLFALRLEAGRLLNSQDADAE
jgi:hypothetical protein